MYTKVRNGEGAGAAKCNSGLCRRYQARIAYTHSDAVTLQSDKNRDNNEPRRSMPTDNRSNDAHMTEACSRVARCMRISKFGNYALG